MTNMMMMFLKLVEFTAIFPEERVKTVSDK